tara:strand:+ start:99 stop:437 length:339 start_codon:yes stop_codon:yes gene_type:complete
MESFVEILTWISIAIAAPSFIIGNYYSWAWRFGKKEKKETYLNYMLLFIFGGAIFIGGSLICLSFLIQYYLGGTPILTSLKDYWWVIVCLLLSGWIGNSSLSSILNQNKSKN